MSYRPICDTWILARSKVTFFGAYPSGFLSRARALPGVNHEDRVLHVCSGKVREYPYDGFGPRDMTMDLDASLNPDIIGDANQLADYERALQSYPDIKAILADPPYTRELADNYSPGRRNFPSADTIVRNAISVLPVGGRVGVLSLHWPRYPKASARQVALVSVYVGNGNVGRTYAVFEKHKGSLPIDYEEVLFVRKGEELALKLTMRNTTIWGLSNAYCHASVLPKLARRPAQAIRLLSAHAWPLVSRASDPSLSNALT
jgi:hypothetical protein